MSTTAIGGPTGVDETIRTLVTRIDADHDGTISKTEFVSFLTELMNGISEATTGASAASRPAAAAEPAPRDAGALIPPSQWNDNNAPYGVTFAGYSPQDHTDLSVADLSKPQNAKYAVYDYLLSNRVAADSTWAYAAADALNTQVGSNLFRAIDGETLAYGDEYVHSAPNGYGMKAGTYNTSATGEFFWGFI